MNQIKIARFRDLQLIDHLVVESLSQGFGFVDRLVKDYRDNRNRFSRHNEILLMASVDDRAIAIGGLNQDPYSNDINVGRLRHLYVESSWRRLGVGSLLVSRIVEEASKHYQVLTLRTDNRQADKFYRALGFQTEPSMPHTTHYLKLNV